MRQSSAVDKGAVKDHARLPFRHRLIYIKVCNAVIGTRHTEEKRMLLTLLMIALLVGSFALFAGLVRFCEGVIALPPDAGAQSTGPAQPS